MGIQIKFIKTDQKIEILVMKWWLKWSQNLKHNAMVYQKGTTFRLYRTKWEQIKSLPDIERFPTVDTVI